MCVTWGRFSLSAKFSFQRGAEDGKWPSLGQLCCPGGGKTRVLLGEKFLWCFCGFGDFGGLLKIFKVSLGKRGFLHMAVFQHGFSKFCSLFWGVPGLARTENKLQPGLSQQHSGLSRVS